MSGGLEPPSWGPSEMQPSSMQRPLFHLHHDYPAPPTNDICCLFSCGYPNWSLVKAVQLVLSQCLCRVNSNLENAVSEEGKKSRYLLANFRATARRNGFGASA